MALCLGVLFIYRLLKAFFFVFMVYLSIRFVIYTAFCQSFSAVVKTYHLIQLYCSTSHYYILIMCSVIISVKLVLLIKMFKSIHSQKSNVYIIILLQSCIFGHSFVIIVWVGGFCSPSLCSDRFF